MLILAVAVVAVRAGSPGTLEAATGTIDVVNVGTCYTTDDEVFEVGDCVADTTGAAYDVAERDEIVEVGTVYATYAHDPLTAPDNPRGVLYNSNLIKISIADSGRDKRTPILLAAGDAPVNDADGASCGIATNLCEFDQENLQDTPLVEEKGYLQIIRDDFDGIALDEEDFLWQKRDVQTDDAAFTEDGNGVIDGVSIRKNAAAVAAGTPFKPMDVADESLVTFYGRVDENGNGNYDDVGEGLRKLTEFKLDEDVGSGRIDDEDGDGSQEVAPWLSIQKSITSGATVRLMYIVYHTSEFETLIGGKDAGYYVADGDDANEDPDDPELVKAQPDFSKAETNANAELVVEARSDGRDGRQFLKLRETSRFSGRYEGYLALTDENGDDEGWGLNTDKAMSHEIGGPAIIGVESGPVVVAYKDTDGSTKLLEVEIDTVPPAITIDTPANESQGQDTSPEFSGSFVDRDSGLRDETFRLYIDHRNDGKENGEDYGSLALDLNVKSTGDGAYGVVTATGDVVESQSEYAGYPTATANLTNKNTFGVITHDKLFNVEEAKNTVGQLDNIRGIEGDNHDDGATEGTFGDSERISFLSDADYNNTIDFQALVADRAGNVGFSDSDADGPSRINDLGEALDDRKTDRYNVLGWYARHIFFLDETDPVIFEEQSVTGFFGEDDDDVPQANRSGILVAFDRAVDPDSIGVDTFTVTLDSAGTDEVSVVDVDVDGRAVYLMLGSELASDARPYVDVDSGQWVSDPAGNRVTGGDVSPFEVKDGIAPVMSVELSGGTGSGEGDEGPAKLTMDTIIVTISADEEINATPSLAVVCSEIGWDGDTTDDVDENDKALSDLVGMRSGAIKDRGSANFNSPAKYYCGSLEVEMQPVQSYSRPGLTWEYQWLNFAAKKALEDGKLTVVAYARDRQSFTSLDAIDIVRDIDDEETPANTYNWGAETAEFRYDTGLINPTPTPKEDATVTESRPFVLLAYDDPSSVSIEAFSVDGTAQEINSIGANRFLYWPESLDIATHTVTVDAIDAAGNENSHEYSFKVAERAAFNLKLIAGWNAVSLPANPADNAIGDVFTEDVIDMVAGWDSSDPEKPWSIATRMEDDWSTHEQFATLNKIHAQYGYWVHAQGFVTQRVQLIGGINRTDPDITPPDLVSIPTLPGWNFVGVIDQDGDQTEADFGETLANGTTAVKAGDYLGNNKRAYTWDAIRSKFDILEDDNEIEIGQGIWVYFGGGVAP